MCAPTHTKTTTPLRHRGFYTALPLRQYVAFGTLSRLVPRQAASVFFTKMARFGQIPARKVRH
jgi:hypothetical protein